MNLEEYKNKRKFDSTPEPEGVVDSKNLHRFVIQRHQASHLHYDVRLEMEGVLKSWAVPKGPSMNPKDKRLAIQTEDHPVKYLTFHGNIPKGNYGAGEMQIWDEGTYNVISEEKDQELQQLKNGDLKIEFFGSKIKGKFALVNMKDSEQNNQWLLIKKKDQFATDLIYDSETFVTNTSKKSSEKVISLSPQHLIKPMLATAGKKIFNDPKWIYEIKWDGYRVISHITNGSANLYSRNGISYNQKFKKITETLETIPHDVILDGEVVVVDKNGNPDFQKLQNYNPQTTEGTLRYYVFDMLYLNGYDMHSLPLLKRKSLLPEIIDGLDEILVCEHVEAMGTTFYNKAIEMGLEGVIAKKKDSIYVPDSRSEDWLKFKAFNTEETLICGYTDSDSGSKVFGSLILGMYSDNELKYVGNCGSGFSDNKQKKLLNLFEKFQIDKNPFPKKINLKGRKPNWLTPHLVCEVKFSEWTKSGVMRHPVFKHLRTDKDPSEVSTVIDQKIDSKKYSDKTSSTLSSNILEIDSISVPISNLEKVYWPDSGLRKYDLIDYYLKVADVILPYLKDRPQNLHRHPNGILKPGFYQKDNENLPSWIKSISLASKSAEKNIEYLLCQDEATLIYMANLGCIEINPWNSRISHLDNPDYSVIDLDPSDNNTFDEIIETALIAKEILDAAQIDSYIKTSGSTGLHIYIPLGAKYSYQEARDFTKILCYFIQEKLPELTSMERAVKNRKGKIYLDYLQNRKAQTLASAYCVRPKKDATVSAPLAWEEVKLGLRMSDFNIHTMPKRIEEHGDKFRPVLTKFINMEKALSKLNQL